MKFTKNWLLDYLQTSVSFEEILDGLLAIGLEVEQVIDYSEKLKNFSVAEILTAKPHPNANKLQVCTVNTANGVKEIVCGAPNARGSIKVIFAAAGVFIPGTGITLKEAEIRGIKSSGMMLSERELGISNEHDSIIEVDKQFKVGEAASIALGLNDTLIEVAITPNLGHLLSVRAIAEALAANGLGEFKTKETKKFSTNIWFKNTESNTTWEYYNNTQELNKAITESLSSNKNAKTTKSNATSKAANTVAADISLQDNSVAVNKTAFTTKAKDSLVADESINNKLATDNISSNTKTQNTIDKTSVITNYGGVAGANNVHVMPLVNNANSSNNCSLIIKLDSNISGALVAAKLTAVNNNIVTPLWMQSRLKLIGQNLISPLVDITNYLTIDLNHPMHAYDSDNLEGDLTVTYGNKEDSILALDHKNYNNLENIPVIKSNNKAVALAGVIGGENFSVTAASKNITLECAHFYPLEVTKASKKLAINTTSSYHFQRGVNPFNLIDAISVAINLIQEICGGALTAIIMVQNLNNESKLITTTTGYINSILGANLSQEVIVSYLTKQDFKVQLVNSELAVEVPYYRSDIEQECDLAETVLKAYGINNIALKKLNNCEEAAINDHIADIKEDSKTTGNKEQNLNKQDTKNYFALSLAVKKSLAELGLLESINMSFIAERTAKLFNIYSDELKLLNPISTDLAVMRKSLIPSLVQIAANNNRLGYSNVTFFEVANIYNSLSSSNLSVAAILSGTKHKKNWYYKEQIYNTFDIKTILFNLIYSLGLNPDKFKLSKEKLPSYFHPGKSGALLLGNIVLAYFGELHPKLTEQFNLKNNPAVFELFLEELPLPKLKLPLPIKELPKLMPLERDFAFIVDNKVKAIDIIKTVSSLNKQLISEVRIFDIFTSKEMGSKKSVAFAVTLTPKVTLTDGEINSLSRQIITAVSNKLGGILRDENLKF